MQKILIFEEKNLITTWIQTSDLILWTLGITHRTKKHQDRYLGTAQQYTEVSILHCFGYNV